MPLPKPHKGEEQDAFMARCMHEAYGSDAPPDRTQEQAVAMCMSAWRDAHPASAPAPKKTALELRRQVLVPIARDAPDPDDGESHDDYIDRCVSEMTENDDGLDEADAQEACEMAWQDWNDDNQDRGQSGDIIRKTHITETPGMEFILSDGSVDRMGDVIEPGGWRIDSFLNNPVALFNHNPNLPIGRWTNVRIGEKDLRAHLVLAKRGTGPRVDEITKLIEADILRAVSVGFSPLKHEPIDPKTKASGGRRFLEQELVETSVVSVPANRNALAVAKSLNISSPTLRAVFGAHAGNDILRRGYSRGEHADRDKTGKPIGEHAEAKRRDYGKGNTMLLSQRIQESEKGLLALQDQLDKHLESIDDDNPTEEQMIVTEDLSAKIEIKQRHLGNLKSIEAKNGAGAEDLGNVARRRGELIPKAPAELTLRRHKKPEPLDYFFRAALVRAKSRVDGQSIDDTRRRIYGDDEVTKVVCDYVLKAASAPAETPVTGWAAELVHTMWADFMQVLLPVSVMPRLAAKGLALTFGPNGRFVIPPRNLTPSLGGSFVAEGAAIPVRQGAFASQTLTPKKMAVITTWTREMDVHSTPAIEGLLRQAILEDTAIAMDTVLLDNNAATTVRPAGLRSYQAGIAAAAGAGTPYANFVADYEALYGGLLTLTNGNVRSPTLIINPQQGLSLSMLQPPAAAAPFLPFMAMVDGGRMLKADLIESSTVPTGTAIMVDAADFTTAGQEGPRLEISDQATLHLEDTAPTDIGIPGTPPVVAAPVKSMWQTDSLALRLIMFVNWVMRRPVATWMTGVLWK